MRAISLAGLHRFDEAVRAAREALHAAPSDPFGHFALGKVLAMKGEPQEARKSARTALEMAPRIAGHHLLLAATYAAEHRWKRALECVDRALQLEPENRGGLFARASFLASKGQLSDAVRTTQRLLRLDPHYARGLALYESLQRHAGRRDVPNRSLQTNPRDSYVKGKALDDILHRSVLFRCVLAIDRVMMRVGGQWLLLVTLALGVPLWIVAVTDPPLSRPVLEALRAGSWLFAGFLFAFFFGWCLGDVYLRFHASGRWLLSSLRRKGAEIVSASLVIGSVMLVIAALARSQALAFAGLGVIGGGLSISKSLTAMGRLATPSEFAAALVVSSVAVVAIAAAVGLWDPVLIGSLAACGLAACAARVAGWPRPDWPLHL